MTDRTGIEYVWSVPSPPFADFDNFAFIIPDFRMVDCDLVFPLRDFQCRCIAAQVDCRSSTPNLSEKQRRESRDYYENGSIRSIRVNMIHECATVSVFSGPHFGSTRKGVCSISMSILYSFQKCCLLLSACQALENDDQLARVLIDPCMS